MSRTYRLRRLPQPEGGSLSRRFVDARLRAATYAADEAFLSHLAHTTLKLPCGLRGGPEARCRGWRQSHALCLPAGFRDLLWGIWQASPYTRLGWIRTVWLAAHPAVGYGLALVPSRSKRDGRNFVHRRNRRASKHALRVARGELANDWADMLFLDVPSELAHNAMWLT